jgi:hypothetical protein
MPNDFEKLFSHFKAVEPTDSLLPKIMRRIQKKRQWLAVRRLVVFSFGLGASTTAFVLALKLAWIGFVESGFAEFLSLLFTDTATIAVYWRNFIFSLLEALPATSLIALLIAALVFLESFKFFARNFNLFLSFRNDT